MKKVHISVPRNPGIYRVMMKDEKGRLHAPKRGLPFVARYSVLENGKKVPKAASCETIHEARGIRARGPSPKVDHGGVQFEELLKRWRGNLSNLGMATKNNYESKLRHFAFFNGMRVADISPAIISDWLTELRTKEYLASQKSTRSSYRQEMMMCKAILNYYREEFDHTYSLPFLKRHMKSLTVRDVMKKNKDMTMGEFQKFSQELKAVCDEEFEWVYYIALFQYGIYGRIQEAAALHYEDFTNEHVKVHRRVQWPRRKGEKARVVSGSKANPGKLIPITPYLRKILKEWRGKTNRIKGPLFSHNGIVPYRAIQYRYDLALEKAGIEFTGTHLLRHASLTEVYHQSKDIKTTAHLAGHASIATTQRYAKARDSQARQTQERMSEELMAVLG